MTSTDYVPALLEGGRRRAAAEGPAVTFEGADAENLPYGDASFDVVLSTYGVMFRTIAKHVRALFEGVATIEHTPRFFNFRYKSAEHFVDVFRTFYGPTHKAFLALDAARQAALEADMLALLRKHDVGGGRGLVVPARSTWRLWLRGRGLRS